MAIVRIALSDIKKTYATQIAYVRSFIESYTHGKTTIKILTGSMRGYIRFSLKDNSIPTQQHVKDFTLTNILAPDRIGKVCFDIHIDDWRIDIRIDRILQIYNDQYLTVNNSETQANTLFSI